MSDSLNSFRRYCKIILWEEYDKICQKYQKNLHSTEKIRSLGILNIELFHAEGNVLVIIDTINEFDYDTYHSFGNTHQHQPDFFLHLINFRPVSQNGTAGSGFLERIFELKQKAKYDPEKGQLKPFPSKKCKRFCKTLELKPDPSLINRYKEIHDIGACWPEIIQGMEEVGIVDMELYLSGNKTYMIMDIVADREHDEVMMALEKKPRQQEWEEYVSQYQKAVPDSSAKGKWKTMETLESGRFIAVGEQTF